MPQHTALFEEEQPPRHVHFLTSGVASAVICMEDGQGMEVGVIGREGMPERIHLLGPQRGNARCMMQVSGEALRMDFSRFQQILAERSPLLRCFHQYIQYELQVLAQLSACNRLHDVQARMARWLLMIYDRIRVPDIVLTQEFLAQMLGIRRSTVSDVLGGLQHTGAISYSRGNIHVQDRPVLEGLACECYFRISKLYQRLYH